MRTILLVDKLLLELGAVLFVDFYPLCLPVDYSTSRNGNFSQRYDYFRMIDILETCFVENFRFNSVYSK